MDLPQPGMTTAVQGPKISGHWIGVTRKCLCCRRVRGPVATHAKCQSDRVVCSVETHCEKNNDAYIIFPLWQNSILTLEKVIVSSRGRSLGVYAQIHARVRVDCIESMLGGNWTLSSMFTLCEMFKTGRMSKMSVKSTRRCFCSHFLVKEKRSSGSDAKAGVRKNVLMLNSQRWSQQRGKNLNGTANLVCCISSVASLLFTVGPQNRLCA